MNTFIIFFNFLYILFLIFCDISRDERPTRDRVEVRVRKRRKKLPKCRLKTIWKWSVWTRLLRKKPNFGSPSSDPSKVRIFDCLNHLFNNRLRKNVRPGWDSNREPAILQNPPITWRENLKPAETQTQKYCFPTRKNWY